MSSTQTGKQAFKTFKIGTRGSALALYQAELVRNLLIQKAQRVDAPYTFEIVKIKTLDRE